MAQIQDTKKSHVAFIWDFESVHRIVAVIKDDWGLQACSLTSGNKKELDDTDEVLLNTVGTFGISSAVTGGAALQLPSSEAFTISPVRPAKPGFCSTRMTLSYAPPYECSGN